MEATHARVIATQVANALLVVLDIVGLPILLAARDSENALTACRCLRSSRSLVKLGVYDVWWSRRSPTLPSPPSSFAETGREP